MGGAPGSGDAENFSYNPSTGRITGFQMVVNGAADTGTLTWNSNATLGQMAISDGISDSTDSETCNYGYDDLARQSSVNCGTGWAQNFSYDAFGNIAKTVPSGSTGSAFSPTYSSATNQFTSIPGVTPGYDGDGRLLTDNVNTYTWDPWGDLATVNGTFRSPRLTERITIGPWPFPFSQKRQPGLLQRTMRVSKEPGRMVERSGSC